MKENVTILSIDDDPQICFALGELFKFQGWRAVSASDVASGLEAFRRYSPDIVLIDYHMPGVSGIEGVKLLRRQSSKLNADKIDTLRKLPGEEPAEKVG